MVSNPIIAPLAPAQQKEVQKFVGVFRHYAATIDTTMIAVISSIATSMTTIIAKDLNFRMRQFLDYAATHPDVKNRYIASHMKIWVHSDASYHSEPKARSCAGGYFYLSSTSNLPIDATSPTYPTNGSILIMWKDIYTIVSSAQEAETGAAFINTREVISIQTTLV